MELMHSKVYEGIGSIKETPGEQLKSDWNSVTILFKQYIDKAREVIHEWMSSD